MNTGQTRKGDDTQWVIDFGVSQHMTANKHLLTIYQEFDVPETVRLGDGQTVEAYGSGQVKITVTISQNKDISALLEKVSLVPKSCYTEGVYCSIWTQLLLDRGLQWKSEGQRQTH